MWVGTLFHLAPLLCARQVVRKKEGGSESEGEKVVEGREKKEVGGTEALPDCPSAVSQQHMGLISGHHVSVCSAAAEHRQQLAPDVPAGT